ncbi:hypothetical protein P3S67_023264 [Capsicum chacoense]
MLYWVDRTNSLLDLAKYKRDKVIKIHRLFQFIDENSLAAELKSVHWLEVFGRIDKTALTPETLYEVAFVEKIKENADGLESIFLRLIIPNKSSNEVTVNIMNVTETEKLNCKHGLVIKGIVIRPKA